MPSTSKYANADNAVSIGCVYVFAETGFEHAHSVKIPYYNVCPLCCYLNQSEGTLSY